MPRLADRVRDTTASTGTGSITLSGTAPAGFQTFAQAFGSGSSFVRYVIQGTSEWEVGVGTFNGTTGLTRDSVEFSSNGNALVNFSAGTKDVFVTASTDDIKAGSVGKTSAIAAGWAMP